MSRYAPYSHRRIAIKALSIMQPWATLIILGAKRYETRNWSTHYRGPLVIHASTKFPEEVACLCLQEPFRTILKDAGYAFGADLPRGVLLGTVDLLDCKALHRLPVGCQEGCLSGFTARELALGDYRSGRYAWKLGNPRPYTTRIAVGGRLGLFEVRNLLEMKCPAVASSASPSHRSRVQRDTGNIPPSGRRATKKPKNRLTRLAGYTSLEG